MALLAPDGPTRSSSTCSTSPGATSQRATLLLRDLLADYPEQRRRWRATCSCASRRATGSPTTSSTALAERGRRPPRARAADVHALAGALDDIVDYAEEAADQLGLYASRRRWSRRRQIADVLVGAAEQVADGAARAAQRASTLARAPRRDPPAGERGRPAQRDGRGRRCSPPGSTRWS